MRRAFGPEAASEATTSTCTGGEVVSYLSINDELFDRTITLRQSYDLLVRFVAQYHSRGESTTLALLSDVGIAPDGTTCDPAQVYDFVRLAGDLLGDEQLRSAAKPD